MANSNDIERLYTSFDNATIRCIKAKDYRWSSEKDNCEDQVNGLHVNKG